MRRMYYIVAIVLSVIFIVAGLIYFEAPEIQNKAKVTITILTYPSLLNYGPNPNETYNYVFGNFEKWYHVNIIIKNASGDLLNALEQSGGKGYDIVIGLNNLDAYAAYKSGLFYKFTVSNESFMNVTIMKYMDSMGYVIPYEYSYLTTDYNLSGPLPLSIIKNLSLTDFYNTSIGSQFIVENPLTSITGEEFLLEEYAFYENVLRENWTNFWINAKSIYITSDWSSGFNIFESGEKQLFYSYLTDPAYNQYFNYTPIGTTPFKYENSYYSWMEVLGIGILNSSSHKPLDEDFVNWFLGKEVQNQIPINEWMFPVNNQVILPSVFHYIPNPDQIIPLNEFVNGTFVYLNLSNLELEWDEIETK